jgi:hypothetical protein
VQRGRILRKSAKERIMSAVLNKAVADAIIGDAQEARWVASTAAGQLAGARETMLAGDLDDADAAIRRAETAMRIIADAMGTIIRNATR